MCGVNRVIENTNMIHMDDCGGGCYGMCGVSKVIEKTSFSLSSLPADDSMVNSILALAQPSEINDAIEKYTPPEVGPEIWVGSVVSLIPIVYASILFNERIQTQRACLVCTGSGLVSITKSGTTLTRPRKCYNCGGLLPWLGWKYFWFSTFFDVGNGGVLQYPAKDYEANQEMMRKRIAEQGDTNPNLDSNSDATVE